MKFIKSLIISSTLFCSASLAFIACGGDDEDEASEEGSSPDSTETPESEGTDGVDVSTLGTVSTNAQGYREVSITVGSHTYTFVEVPAGAFTMGSESGLENESPARSVTLSTYWISKYHITLGQFKTYITESGNTSDAQSGVGCYIYDSTEQGWSNNTNGHYLATGYTQADDHPAVCISWNDAIKFCSWIQSNLGNAYCSLPTEAQWEKAARGTDARTYPWGSSTPTASQANFADASFATSYVGQNGSTTAIDDGYVATSPVTAKTDGASFYGIHDMAGNAGEWCYDYFDESFYSTGSSTDPTGPTSGSQRVNRGGSWGDNLGSTSAQINEGHNILSSSRTGDDQNSSDDRMGFRIVIGDGGKR